jgi:hypothetical protein
MTDPSRPPRRSEVYALECWRCQKSIEVETPEPYRCPFCRASLEIEWGGRPLTNHNCACRAQAKEHMRDNRSKKKKAQQRKPLKPAPSPQRLSLDPAYLGPLSLDPTYAGPLRPARSTTTEKSKRPTVWMEPEEATA